MSKGSKLVVWAYWDFSLKHGGSGDLVSSQFVIL